ncbi:hypothetical protein [Mucilaginibacter sp.]|uniref:hypothetical protein n=1 Tax=Mucilaginibacter sp. TaxID=1882438 RepID=UPI0026294777|nr:hypothetical protein [Mucilaginibacter sp.]
MAVFSGQGGVSWQFSVSSCMVENEFFPYLFTRSEERSTSAAKSGESSPPCIGASALALLSRAYLPTRSTLRWTCPPFAARKEGEAKKLVGSFQLAVGRLNGGEEKAKITSGWACAYP